MTKGPAVRLVLGQLKGGTNAVSTHRVLLLRGVVMCEEVVLLVAKAPMALTTYKASAMLPGRPGKLAP